MLLHNVVILSMAPQYCRCHSVRPSDKAVVCPKQGYPESSLLPRPGFFAGRWKSEGPGISCIRMRLIRHEIIRKISFMMNDVIIKTYVARVHSISAA